MKKLTLITAVALIISGYSPALATTTEQAPVEEPVHNSLFIDFLIQYKENQTLLQQQEAEFLAAQARAAVVSNRITKLEKHIDKTWYVFSGSTPAGWDCSGLVLWFYKGLGVDLEHSATKQMLSGELTEEPILGDIVSFVHNGYDGSYHNGVYIGNGLMIDSPQEGNKTRVRNVLDFAGSSEIRYTRIAINVVE